MEFMRKQSSKNVIAMKKKMGINNLNQTKKNDIYPTPFERLELRSIMRRTSRT